MVPPWLVDEVKNEKEPQEHEAPATLSHLNLLVALAVTYDDKDAKTDSDPEEERTRANEAGGDGATCHQ
jgi:hypothetical protein